MKNQKTKKPKNQKKKKEKKERKRINLTEHDPSERVLFARANTRGRNSEPIAPLHPPLLFLPPPTTLHSPFSPSFIPFTLLLFFFLSFFFPLLKTKFRARFMARTSSNAILVYRVWLGRETRLACPDARQLKQADVHDIAQSVIRIG